MAQLVQYITFPLQLGSRASLGLRAQAQAKSKSASAYNVYIYIRCTKLYYNRL